MRPNPSFELTRSGRAALSQNEMKAKADLPERVSSNEGLGRIGHLELKVA